MKSTDLLLFVAIIAVVFASINLMVTINKVGDLKSLTGFASDQATANLTILTNIDIIFNLSIINWGSGYVSTGNLSAELNTEGYMNGTGWTNISQGLILENVGSSDCQFNLTSSKNASEFIGGDQDGGAIFQWNMTTLNYNNVSEPNACPPGFDITSWTNATTSISTACDNFTFLPDEDEIRLDLRVVVPLDSDAEAKGTTITAYADVVV